MTELESLVVEWRNARTAILLVNWGDPVIAKANTFLWERLGHAESALMTRARTIWPDNLRCEEPAHGPKQHGWPVGTRICDCVTGEAEPQPCRCDRQRIADALQGETK